MEAGLFKPWLMKLKDTITGLCFTVCLSVAVNSFCNAQSIQDINGKVYRTINREEVSGTPYFEEEFVKGTLKLQSGKIITGVLLKYDEITDQVLFQDAKGITLEVAESLNEFTLEAAGKTVLFRNGFKSVDTHTAQSFYEVLWDGKTKLLKKTRKYLTENQGYNGLKEKVINTKVFYYLLKSAQPEQINKNEKSISFTLGLSKTALTAYIQANHLDLKKDDDLIKLVSHFD